nr:hypothetical protein [Kofleriaceae bacterium]
MLAALGVVALFALPTTTLGIHAMLLEVSFACLAMAIGRIAAPGGGKLAAVGCLGLAVGLAACVGGLPSMPMEVVIGASLVVFVIGHALAPGPLSIRFAFLPSAALAFVSPPLAFGALSLIWLHVAWWMIRRAFAAVRSPG